MIGKRGRGGERRMMAGTTVHQRFPSAGNSKLVLSALIGVRKKESLFSLVKCSS